MHIRQATIRDASAIGEMSNDAMAADELADFLMPYSDKHPLCRREGVIRRCRQRFYNPGNIMLVMVSDATDEDWDGVEHIVGHIAMASTVPMAPQPLAQRLWLGLNSYLHSAEDTARWYLHSDRSQSNANVTKFLKTVTTMDVGQYLEPQGRSHYYIFLLAVSPDRQRRGIGRALIKHVQDQAAAENMPITLVSSNAGQPLYRSCGFRDVAQSPVAEGFGQTSPVMVWDPPAQD